MLVPTVHCPPLTVLSTPLVASCLSLTLPDVHHHPTAFLTAHRIHQRDVPLVTLALVKSRSFPRAPQSADLRSNIAIPTHSINQLFRMLHIDSLPSLASFLIASAIFTRLAIAQAILPTTPSASFPACALSCTQLVQAQNSCVPPAAPVTDQYVYDTCFCTSGLLAQLRISPDGTCDQFCTVESDRQLLQSWYTGFCASQTATTSTLPATSSISSALSTITSGVSTVIVILPPATSSSSTASPSVTGTGTTVESTSSSNKPWYVVSATTSY